MTTEPMSAEPMRTERAAIPDLDALHVTGSGVSQVLRAGSVYRIGRDPLAEIAVTESRVSWQHATVERTNDGWLLLDTGSTNGTYVDRQRVSRVPITASCDVRLGHPDDGPVLAFRVDGGAGGAAVGPAGTALWQDEPAAVRPSPAQAPAERPVVAERRSVSGRSPSRVMSAPARM